MAIIKCDNCGNEISDKAKKCIHCHHKIKSIVCKNCGARVDLELNRCYECNKVLRNKIPLLGKIWLFGNVVFAFFIFFIFLVNYNYQTIEALIDKFVILLAGLAIVMNILFFIKLESIYYYIANIICFIGVVILMASEYIEIFIIFCFLAYAIGYAFITYFFIRKCIKDKNKKITLIINGIVSILFISLISYICLNPVETIDFEDKYNDYIKYAFGEDYNIEEINYKKISRFKVYDSTYWTLSYRDANNVTKHFYFNNDDLEIYSDIEFVSDYLFAKDVIEHYETELNNYSYINSVSKLEWLMDFYQIYYVYDNEEDFNYYNFLAHPDILKLIVPGTGINFRNIDFRVLDSNLYFLDMGILYDPSASNTEEYTKREVKKIMDAYHIKNAFVEIGDNYGDNSTVYPTYCVKDNVEFKCPYSDTDKEFLFVNKDNYIKIYME